MANLTNATEFLYSLKWYNKEIAEKIDILDQLRAIATSVTVCTDKDAIQTSSSNDKMSGIVAKIVDLENEIDGRTKALISNREIAKEIIFEISNEGYQDILYDFFITNHELYEVADMLNVKYDAARKRLHKAEKEFEMIFEGRKARKIQNIEKK